MTVTSEHTTEGTSRIARIHLVWVGEAPDVASALAALGAELRELPETAGALELVEAAPDLVLTADPERAAALAAELLAAFPRSAVPICLIEPGGSGAVERRSGIAARLDPAAPEELAAGIVQVALAVAVPLRGRADIERAALPGLLDDIAYDDRAGLVWCLAPPLGFAVRPDAVSSPQIQLLTERLGRAVGTMEVMFAERPSGRLAVLLHPPEASAAPARLAAASCVVVDTDPIFARVASAMTAAGATVTRLRAGPELTDRAAAHDPALLVLSSDALADATLARALADDPRLAPAALLVIQEGAVRKLDPATLLPIAAALLEDDIEARAALERGAAVLGRIETLGVARWLEAVKRCPGVATLELRAPGGTATVTAEGGEVREVTFTALAEPPISGRDALQAALALAYGTVMAGPIADLSLARPSRAIEAPAKKPKAAAPSPGQRKSSVVTAAPQSVGGAKKDGGRSSKRHRAVANERAEEARATPAPLPKRVANARQTAPMKFAAPAEVSVPSPRTGGSIPLSDLEPETAEATPPPVRAAPVLLVTGRSSTQPFELKRLRSRPADTEKRRRRRALASIDLPSAVPALPRARPERTIALVAVLLALAAAAYVYRDALGLW